MRIMIRGTLIALALTLGASPALACGPESYMAEVCITASTYCPEGTLPANGQTVQIQQSQALFALLGTRFGGDGKSTFGLPNLRDNMPQPLAGLTFCITERGLWPPRTY